MRFIKPVAVQRVAADQIKLFHQQIKTIERKVEQLIGRITETENNTVITAYEKSITKLEMKKALLKENAVDRGAETGKNRTTPGLVYEEMFEHAMQFLANPVKLWRSEQLEDSNWKIKGRC